MDVAEIISHHILDHDWGISWAGVRLPITTHSVTLLTISVLLLGTLYWISLGRQTRAGRLLTTLAEWYVSFIRDGMVLPNMGQEGRGFLPYFCTLFLFYEKNFVLPFQSSVQ